MSSIACEGVGSEAVERRGNSAVRARVWGVLGAIYPQGGVVERRHDRRFPYPYLIYLTPVDKNGQPTGESLVVVGKQLSERGLSFYHPKPLPHRRMIATLDSTGGDSASFVIDVAWCRFTRQGWYESGGQLLETVGCPLPQSESAA